MKNKNALLTILRSLAVLFIGTALSASSAFAQANNDPPPTGAILDLGGAETGTAAQTIDHGTAITESVDFTAAFTSTDITFAFREDPAFISFSDVTLTNVTTGSSTNLILNGNFASGSSTSATDWTYANIYGATFGGVVDSNCGGGLATCWFDGAVEQTVSLIVGDTYALSFEYSDDGSLTTFSDLSTNGDTTDTGGNGVDILAYAQAGLPPAGGATPEPTSIVLAATGLLSLVGARRMRRA
jgi:hypothetical protein